MTFRNRSRPRTLAIAALLAAAGVLVWRYHLDHLERPAPESRPLFEGVTYRRDIRRTPRPLVIHVVSIDLRAPGIGFLVTPPAGHGARPLRAQRTSEFLVRHHLQVAVNGDYFYPFRSRTILDYYPHAGDPVAVEGIAASRGDVYSGSARSGEGGKSKYPTLYLSRDNRVSFRRPIGPVYNAVSGSAMILRDGRNCFAGRPVRREPQPSTAVAIDKSGRTLLFIVVDGRQPGRSEGVGEEEFGEIIRSYGGWSALDLDGGGSESLVAEGADGKPELLNEPMDCRIPGRERIVANHLGVYAHPLVR